MKVINCLSGPSVGKSTLAAEIFVYLKKKYLNVELVTEYAKDKVWEESFAMMQNQLYLFGKQQHRLWRLSGKCDFVVTDSPLILSLHYGKNNSEVFKNLVLEEFLKYDNLNIFLKRSFKYNPIGRIQTEEEAIAIDNSIKNILIENNIPFTEFELNENKMDNIIKFINEFIN